MPVSKTGNIFSGLLCRAALPLCAAVLLLLAGQVVPAAETELSERHFAIMGTRGVFRFGGAPATVARAEDEAMFALERVQICCNLYDQTSELARLNRTAAQKPFVCSPLLYDILREARRAWRESGGAFDITAKPLLDLWGFYRKRAALPEAAEIAAALSRVGLDKVRFDDEARSVFFTVPDMALDLGGIAKGYAIDRAFEAAARCGASPLLVDVGGNLRMHAGGGKAFRIGIRDPLGGALPVLTTLCREGAFSTSGGYERFVTYGGCRYPHILDPATGRPGAGVLAVTVASSSACEADWMSTAVFLRGARLAERFAPDRAGRRIWLFTPGADGKSPRLTVFPAAPLQ